jgi:hypothetical protein
VQLLLNEAVFSSADFSFKKKIERYKSKRLALVRCSDDVAWRVLLPQMYL